MDNTKEPTTNKLVELAKSGYRDALEAIISRHRAEVYNAAKFILNNEQDAEDHEDKNYVYFTDPEAIFPDEGYVPSEEVLEEDLTDEEVIIDDPVYDDNNIIYEVIDVTD